MFAWIKKYFKKSPELQLPKLEKGEVRIRFRLPNGKIFYVYAIDPQQFKK